MLQLVYHLTDKAEVTLAVADEGIKHLGRDACSERHRPLARKGTTLGKNKSQISLTSSDQKLHKMYVWIKLLCFTDPAGRLVW